MKYLTALGLVAALPAVNAVAFGGPAPTGTSPKYVLGGMTPKPTNGPSVFELRKRQSLSPQLCGWIDGDEGKIPYIPNNYYHLTYPRSSPILHHRHMHALQERLRRHGRLLQRLGPPKLRLGNILRQPEQIRRWRLWLQLYRRSLRSQMYRCSRAILRDMDISSRRRRRLRLRQHRNEQRRYGTPIRTHLPKPHIQH